jgi:hypothetical protein
MLHWLFDNSTLESTPTGALLRSENFQPTQDCCPRACSAADGPFEHSSGASAYHPLPTPRRNGVHGHASTSLAHAHLIQLFLGLLDSISHWIGPTAVTRLCRGRCQLKSAGHPAWSLSLHDMHNQQDHLGSPSPVHRTRLAPDIGL